MHIAARSRSRQWPEWSASVATGHPLELVDDAHSAIDAMIELAIAAGEQAVEDRMDDVAIAVRTHIDVTQRVLYPMARRVGGEEGELLADAAEAQERRLSRLVADIDRANVSTSLQDICVEMQTHAASRATRYSSFCEPVSTPLNGPVSPTGWLPRGATSTVNRLRRTATRFPAHSVRKPPRRPLDDAEQTLGGRPAIGPQPGSRPAELASDDAPLVDTPPARHDKAPVEHVANPVVARSGRITESRPRRDNVAAIKRILVGVDGSAAAAAALEWAGRLAGRVGAEILVGNVFEPDQAEVSPDEYERLIAEAEHSLNAEWSEPLRGSGVQHRGLQLIGAPDSLLAAS